MEGETTTGRLDDNESSKDRPANLPHHIASDGLSRFVPILPKPLPPPPPREPTPFPPAPPPSPAPSPTVPALIINRQRKGTTPKICPLAACRRVDCRLRTHQVYARNLLRHNSSSSQSDQSSNSQAVVVSSRSSTSSPNSAGVDGLPQLPVAEVNSAEYRSLFHDFFHRVRARITLLLIPPAITQSRKQFAMQTETLAFASALTNPVYCLNAIAAAYFEQTLRKRGFSKDRSTAAMYGYLIQLLRQKLDDFSGGEVEDLLVVILTLVIFDAAAGKLSSLAVHKKGMVHLVNKAGGFHNLDRFLPYVIALDRTFAIYSGEPSLYTSHPDRGLFRPARFPEVYGSSFNDKDTMPVSDENIAIYASDACRTIELLEGLKIDFDPRNQSTANIPESHYLYFVRDQVSVEFVDLNVVYFRRHDTDKIVLYAAKIVDYVVLHDNYIVTTPAFLAQKVREAVEGQVNIGQEWKGKEKVFRWVLFVLAVLPSLWDGTDWAICMLQHILSGLYANNGVWVDDWQDLELENVRGFVWSNTRLDTLFQKVCSRIEEMDDEHEISDDDCDGNVTVCEDD